MPVSSAQEAPHLKMADVVMSCDEVMNSRAAILIRSEGNLRMLPICNKKYVFVNRHRERNILL